MKKVILISVLTILFAVSALTLIHFTNDHKECKTIEETVYLKNESVKTTTNKHICKEKYNF